MRSENTHTPTTTRISFFIKLFSFICVAQTLRFVNTLYIHAYKSVRFTQFLIPIYCILALIRPRHTARRAA